MNIPMSWLREYVDIECSTRSFADTITLAGQKVESVVERGAGISNVVVGRINSIRRHPDADKLVICAVDAGQGRELQILTGASNVFEGAYVPVALDGAMLADGKTINTGAIRGQISEGMLCSIEELGATCYEYPEAPENGIYIFDGARMPGTDALAELTLRDDVVEFEITSNRPDCFSVIGIAREAAAAYAVPLRYPKISVKEEAEGDISKMVSVEILNPELCPRYIARVVKNVTIGPSPQWMRHKLSAAGVRPINNIVDITNYVMLELGQPMHAFDIDNITGRKIMIRNAFKGEVFKTLDGVKRVLDPSMAMVADREKAVAIAGVMGGENSMVTGDANMILLESANFAGMNVRLTSKKLGLRTDASSKFEKGIDPNLALTAINRAAQLIEEIGCGEVVKGCVDCYPKPRAKWSIEYSAERINNLLGTDISAEDMAGYLNRLEIKTETSNGKTKAVIPTFRPDLEIGADLAEEVARLYGYDKITPTLSAGTPTLGRISEKQGLDALVRDTMTALGLCEGMTYSFESPKVFDRLRISAESGLRKTVRIINPLGEDYSIMRTQTAAGMLGALATNYNRRNPEAKLYEIGCVYLPKSLPLNELPDEVQTLTMGMYGEALEFGDISGMIRALFERLGIYDYELSAEHGVEYLHPGRAAKIIIGSMEAGYIGEVHPEVAEEYGIGGRPYIAVVNLDMAYQQAKLLRIYKVLPRYPEISRDLSLLVPDNVSASRTENVIRGAAGEYLEGVDIFDVYRGAQVQAGYKSISYKLVFRAPDRSLKDEEAVSFMNDILSALKAELGVSIR